MGAIRHERIACDPAIMTGKPTIKGTRITVELLLRKLGAGMGVHGVCRSGGGAMTVEGAAAERVRPDLVPRALLDGVVAYFDPVRVILFGSHARGDVGPDSDYDLLVLVDDDAPKEKLHWRAAWEARRGFHGAVDIVMTRETSFREKARVRGTVAHAIAGEGVVVYERR